MTESDERMVGVSTKTAGEGRGERERVVEEGGRVVTWRLGGRLRGKEVVSYVNYLAGEDDDGVWTKQRI